MVFRRLALPLLLASFAGSAQAIPLLDFGVGDEGFGTEFLPANDDESTNLLELPFDINFFGSTYSSFFVNNNGNITFESALGTFTPDPFPVASQPMIAPYWADVDTRVAGNLWIHSPNADTLAVTWSSVGYFGDQIPGGGEEGGDGGGETLLAAAVGPKTNSFQLVLRNRADTGAGNFDIDFRYERLEWTTGDASEGSDGLGGIPAQAGYDAGDGVNFLTLPGSRSDAVLDLQHASNVSAETPGLWTFAIRNGAPPGSSPSNPLLPVATDEGWSFTFNVRPGETFFIDPDIAIGYDYFLESGPLFASVLLPELGDNAYEIWLWNGTEWVFADNVLAGEEYTLSEGVDRFRVLGIEESVALDPLNPTAFVTGLTFDGSGAVQLSQNPIVLSLPVPEPETYAMFLAGLGLIVAARRRVRS
ncbi:PEP-CTERM sorting domain-containing protein [Methyloversatilis sp. XJ19-13]|uniref:nidogen-like domain-containing protein n=1 Tax=Methyloversatilis sp. XJ19-13 TaxID=2963430 RepID=UPI00211BCB63|nr:nidogen-like domain-containing protein [Methyloversatilis sp. XJ19-13]MCQ9375365.1 PEP-CTERM sorting domain-containing protein [Methyloversatilis sp. XJ19-13]